jgi:lactoylglutathione lyase
MLRVKDAEKSLAFYQDVLGMTLVRTSENEKAGFNLYFLGYGPKPADGEGTADREGLLELTWNYGTEKDENFAYHDGNKEPQGFGHICEFFSLPSSFLYSRLLTTGKGISVDDLDAACARLEGLKVNWKKRLTDGRMKNVAFVLDPDGYWVEIVQNERFSNKHSI